MDDSFVASLGNEVKIIPVPALKLETDEDYENAKAKLAASKR
jgi:hypothetical protein